MDSLSNSYYRIEFFWSVQGTPHGRRRSRRETYVHQSNTQKYAWQQHQSNVKTDFIITRIGILSIQNWFFSAKFGGEDNKHHPETLISVTKPHATDRANCRGRGFYYPEVLINTHLCMFVCTYACLRVCTLYFRAICSYKLV